MYKAIILDRDGTLNATTDILRPGQKPGDKTDGYVLAPQELRLLPGVREALELLRQNGLIPLVFTQQNCIGKELATAEEVAAVHAHMNALLGPEAAVEKFYVAWNTPGQPDSPRAKPAPAMIREAMADYGLAAREVLVIGDSLRDCDSARAAGVDFLWVRDDLGRVDEAAMAETGFPVFDDVPAAVRHFLSCAAAA